MISIKYAYIGNKNNLGHERTTLILNYSPLSIELFVLVSAGCLRYYLLLFLNQNCQYLMFKAILVVVVTCITYVHRSGTCNLIRILNVEVCTLSCNNVLLYFCFICVAERRRR